MIFQDVQDCFNFGLHQWNLWKKVSEQVLLRSLACMAIIYDKSKWTNCCKSVQGQKKSILTKCQYFYLWWFIDTSRVSCQKGPTCHAYACQLMPFLQNTLDLWHARYFDPSYIQVCCHLMFTCLNYLTHKQLSHLYPNVIFPYFLMLLPINVYFHMSWSNTITIYAAPWILIAWCISTRAIVTTELNTHTYVSNCLWVKGNKPTRPCQQWANISYKICTDFCLVCCGYIVHSFSVMYSTIYFSFFPLPLKMNKANLRDLIAATGLVISNWIQIINFSAGVVVKFDGWPRKTIGHFLYTMSSFVHHFKYIGEFERDLQSRNAQFGSKLMICYPVWPWNLMDDLGKQ